MKTGWARIFRNIGGVLSITLAPLGAQDFDLVLVGGRVADGTGNPRYRADVGVRAGRIAEIGRLAGRSAARVIDVKGQVVAPGFVDMMGATSEPLLADRASAESKLRQGITTMLAGGATSADSRTVTSEG